jgi:hypothetical protein
MNAKTETGKLTLEERVAILEEKVANIKVRDRGPKSTRTMTDEDAARVKFGDLKDVAHRKAAQELGLSYGQVYSCRLGYTFNHVKEDAKK